MEFYRSKYSDKRKSARNSKQRGGGDEPSRSFRNSNNDQNSRYPRHDRGGEGGESTTVTCADCGTECTVPFIPKTDRPVYCRDCFRKNRPQDSDGDRYSRDGRSRGKSYDKNTRYSRDSNRGREEGRSTKSKNNKFLKKQEKFYSDGSEKFYESLKEKLFEILGGKKCSNCGFEDERALGISCIYDEKNSNSIGRGGSASSWGKYISDPNLARQELEVFCLNCNQIREPRSKPKEDLSGRSKREKSKYFPR